MLLFHSGVSLSASSLESGDEVAEWLRRWTANPLGSARVGSNPIFVALPHWFYGVMVSTLDFESSDPSSNLGRTWHLTDSQPLPSWMEEDCVNAQTIMSNVTVIENGEFIVRNRNANQIKISVGCVYYWIWVKSILCWSYSDMLFQTKMIPPGLEPGTLCVLGTRDNHYTTESKYVPKYFSIEKYMTWDQWWIFLFTL